MTLSELSTDTVWLSRSSEIAFALAEIADAREGSTILSAALGMGEFKKEDVTKFFLLDLQPNASIYLSNTGTLGGEIYEEIAGFFKVLGADPGTQADHISSMFSLLGYILRAEAKFSDNHEREDEVVRNRAILRARSVLVGEHLLPWAPAYLLRAKEVAPEAISVWASVGLDFLAEQIANIHQVDIHYSSSADVAENHPEDGDLVEWLLAPAKSGLIIAQSDLTAIAQEAGLGKRVGGRRFILKNLLDTDKAAVLGSIRVLAEHQSELYMSHAETFTSLYTWSSKAHACSTYIEEFLGNPHAPRESLYLES